MQIRSIPSFESLLSSVTGTKDNFRSFDSIFAKRVPVLNNYNFIYIQQLMSLMIQPTHTLTQSNNNINLFTLIVYLRLPQYNTTISNVK